MFFNEIDATDTRPRHSSIPPRLRICRAAKDELIPVKCCSAMYPEISPSARLKNYQNPLKSRYLH
jgi:hypothetical protein